MTRQAVRAVARDAYWSVLVAAVLLAGSQADAATHFVVIEGIGGTRAYAESFRDQVEEILPVLRETAGNDAAVRVLAGREATAVRIQAVFEELAGAVAPGDSLAVFLIGHGTHDGDDYKLNIPGPDITARQLDSWLDAVPAAPQLVVSSTSASGGALETLKSASRIVITATRSGRETTATAFGTYWAAALSDAGADTDKNETISALEAFRYAEDKVKAHYADEKRLATEHPVLQGERAEGFLLARLGAAAAQALDPAKRPLLERRQDLERRITDLTQRKEQMATDQYLDALQTLLLEVAELQAELDKASDTEGGERP